MDSEESLVGKDEEVWDEGHGSKMPPHRTWPLQPERGSWRKPSYRWVLDALLVIVIIGLVVDRSYHKERYGQFEGAGDLTGFAPRMSQQIKTFSPDPSFLPENMSDFFSDAVNHKWLSIVPKGLGYVRINNTEDYNNLPTPLLSYPPSTFTTSMTHQLHCLHAIVTTFAAMATNDTMHMPHDGAWHLGHCFDYLRQSIMCCGDMALEGQQTTFPDGFTGSDGWDAKHVCKDYNQILGHLEKQSSNKDVWI
ncbi:hypothetical protein GQ53DRAFT_776820 [Thozetella sp. PMI_491]|nr:hypothetical protein GQ53DRAFT_776820 [Thozetella sp. PMI_491]